MIKKMVHRLFLTGFVAFFSSLSLMAQHKVEMVPSGIWTNGWTAR